MTRVGHRAAICSWVLLVARMVGPAMGNEATPAPPSLPSVSAEVPQSNLNALRLDARADVPPARRKYLPIILREAEANNLPAEIADAVVRIESAYNPAVVGDVGEIGLMQVRPATAGMMGFRGTAAELADPDTNIRYGVSYLAQAWRLAQGDLCRTLMKYRAGHGAESMSVLSLEYCRRARLHLASLGWNGNGKIDLGSLPARPPASADRDEQAAKQPRVRAVLSAKQVGSARSDHPLLVASRAQIAQAWQRASGQARSQAFWAAHRARTIAVRKHLASLSAL